MATTPKRASVRFDTTLTAVGNNTGIVVPPEVVEELGGGKRAAVVVNVNGYEYRNTMATMNDKQMISVSAAIRKETGLAGGDQIRVTLALADSPRPVDIPKDLAAAFKKNPKAKAFFDGLSNSVQRYHVDNINGAKTDETRQRRVDKAIELFLADKPR
ncbi:MAG: YdeI/OmpD-associated family protein [Acidimicrobiia bacterium]